MRLAGRAFGRYSVVAYFATTVAEKLFAIEKYFWRVLMQSRRNLKEKNDQSLLGG